MISRKLQEFGEFEQSYFEARFATPESTLTAPRYKEGAFKFKLNFEEKTKFLKIF